MSACVIWQGPIGNNGYGRAYVGHGERELAHRFVWAQANGPIPEGHIIHHDCGTKACVNLEHLVLTTQAEHASSLDARSPLKSHCVKGHPTPPGSRTNYGACRECGRQMNRRRYRELHPLKEPS